MPAWKKVIVSGSDASLRSLDVTTSFTASGLNYPAADNGEESFIQTDGNGNLSLQYVKTIYEEIVNGEATNLVKGTPVYVSGSVGAAAVVYRADPTNPAKMPAVYISADTIAPAATGRGIALGLIKGVDTTGYPAGTEIYLAPGGGWTSTRPTGSAIVQVLGYVTKEGSGGQGVVLNPGPATLPNLPSGSVWVGNSNSAPVAVATSSLSVLSAVSASYVSGSVVAPGSTTQVVFNNGGVLGTNSGFVYSGSNVGIGTITPTASLHISGASTSTLLQVDSPASSSILFVTGSGRVGIGTSNPLYKLEVASDTTSLNGIRVISRNNSTAFEIASSLDYPNTFSITKNNAFFTIGTSGYLNINSLNNTYVGGGNVIPTARLQIRGSGATSATIGLRVENTNASASLIVNDAGDVYNHGVSGITSNTFYGLNSGRNAAGVSNSFFGVGAGAANTTGNNNTFFGTSAGQSNTTSAFSSYFGSNAGQNSTAQNNSFFGMNAGQNNTTGDANTFIGRSAGTVNYAGTDNTFLGFQAGLNKATGSNNVFLGSNAGRYITGGSVNLVTANQSILIGNNTQAAADNQTNQIVIGHTAVGLGSNTTVIGNSSTTLFRPYGNVAIRKDTANAALDVSGSAIISGSLIATQGITGSLFGTASFALNSLITASISSNVITFTKGDGTTFPITVPTSGGGSTGSDFPYTGSAIISGSLSVTGSFSVNSGTALKIDTATSTLTDGSNITSIDWQNRYLEDIAGNISIDWQNRGVLDSSGNTSADFEQRNLWDLQGIQIIDYSGNNGYNIVNFRPTIETYTPEVQNDFTQGTPGIGAINSNFAGNLISVDANIDLAVTSSNIVSLDSAGTWKRADQTSIETTKLLGVCIEGYNKGKVLTDGIITVTTSSGYTDVPFVSGSSFYGMPVYLTGSIASFTTTKPTSGYVRVVGHMYYNSTTNPDYWIMKFNPSNDWYEI